MFASIKHLNVCHHQWTPKTNCAMLCTTKTTNRYSTIMQKCCAVLALNKFLKAVHTSSGT